MDDETQCIHQERPYIGLEHQNPPRYLANMLFYNYNGKMLSFLGMKMQERKIQRRGYSFYVLKKEQFTGLGSE